MIYFFHWAKKCPGKIRIRQDPCLIGLVLNWPPGSGSVIQDYGSADPDPKEKYLRIHNTGCNYRQNWFNQKRPINKYIVRYLKKLLGRSLRWLASSRSSSSERAYRMMSSGTLFSEQCRLSTYSTCNSMFAYVPKYSVSHHVCHLTMDRYN